MRPRAFPPCRLLTASAGLSREALCHWDNSALITVHAAAHRDQAKERQPGWLGKAVVARPKGGGAPACGIEVALCANTLTPRGKDLFPVLGPRLHHHRLPMLFRHGPSVELVRLLFVPPAPSIL